MDIEIDKSVLATALRFYARGLAYPYDEQTHEFQHLFREMERYAQTEADSAIANKVLDVINFYQGEDMITLQSEYVRMFTPREDEEPLISLHVEQLYPEIPFDDLLNHLDESGLLLELEEDPELITFILEHFSTLLEYADDDEIELFYTTYLKQTLLKLAEQIFRGANINFYKEYAKGLGELIQLID